MIFPALQAAALLPYRFHHIGQAAVPACQDCLNAACPAIVVADGDLPAGNRLQKQLLFGLELLRGILRLKFKRGKGLRHKACHTDIDGDALALRPIGQAVEEIHYLLRQLYDGLDIFLGFGGQAHHKIELDRRIAAFKAHTAGIQHFLLGNIFIDSIPQALAPRLRGKGQTAFAHPLHQFQQMRSHAINTQRGQRKINMLRFRPHQHLFH